jgi:hypothetical protein
MSDPTTPGQYGAAPEPPRFGKDPKPEAADPSTPPPPPGYTAPPQYGTPPSYGTGPAYGQNPQYDASTGGSQSYGPPPGYDQWTQTPPPGYTFAQPEDPGAQAAMITGVISLVMGMLCGVGFVGSPFAMVMGIRSKRRIDAAAGRLGGRGNAQAGFILGLIGTIILVLAILGLIAFIFLIAFAWNGSVTINDTGVNA